MKGAGKAKPREAASSQRQGLQGGRAKRRRSHRQEASGPVAAGSEEAGGPNGPALSSVVTLRTRGGGVSRWRHSGHGGLRPAKIAVSPPYCWDQHRHTEESEPETARYQTVRRLDADHPGTRL